MAGERGFAALFKVLSDVTSEKELTKILATSARGIRDDVARARRRRSGSEPKVTTIVNGRTGAIEESVQLPGPIVYEFEVMGDVGPYAWGAIIARSPRASGHFIRQFQLQVGGVVTAPNKIPAGTQEFSIINPEPYSRAIDTGGVKTRVPPHIFEDVRQLVNRRYGNAVQARVRYEKIEGGYILKTTRAKRRREKNGAVRLEWSKDTRAGAEMTYPVLYVRLR